MPSALCAGMLLRAFDPGASGALRPAMVVLSASVAFVAASALLLRREIGTLCPARARLCQWLRRSPTAAQPKLLQAGA